MKPANLKGAVAAAATYSHLNPNSAIAKTAQSATFGIAPTLATFQQQRRLKPTTTLGLEGGYFTAKRGRLRSYIQLAKWPFSVVAL
jgi:hypothetical protein